MKKILFHSLTIPPDNVSTGNLVAEIASKFVETSNSIEILASTPQYNFDEEAFSNGLLEKKGKKLYESNYKNVKINHIYSSPRSFSQKKRFFQWISFNYQSIKFLIKNKKNFDVLYIFSYPPTMNLVAIISKKILKKKTIYSVWELYPEIAQKLSEINSRLLIRIFKKLDTYALKVIDHVVVNSDQLKEYLIKYRGISAEKIKVIYHFSNSNESTKPTSHSNEIIYTGNLGIPQNIESFIDKLNNSSSNFKLTIYGSGSRYDHIKNMQSTNITVNPYTEREEIIKQTEEATYALVSLSSSLTVEGFPGKTFDYLKMNKILIGYSNPTSGLAKFIEKYNIGININPDDPDFETALKRLENLDNLDEIYENIKKVNMEYASLNIVSEQYLSLL